MMNNLDDLFTYDADARLDADVEVDAIQRAQSGDQEAQVLLLKTYSAVMRKLVARFVRSSDLEVDDAQAIAVESVLRTIQDHDPEISKRIAGRASRRIVRDLTDAVSETVPFDIPERSLSRFYGILRKHEGDLGAAREAAPSMGMTLGLFDEIVGIVRGTSSMSEARYGEDVGDDLLAHPLHGSEDGSFDEVEDRLLVEVAFRAVDDEEARIIELRYGFRSTEDFAHGEEIPDVEVAKIVGLTRPTVQRRRASGLEKMRKATGVTEETVDD